MTISDRTMTADDLWRLPSDGQRHELVRGELRTMAPAGGGHGAVAMRLGSRLCVHVERERLGVVLAAETGFFIQRNPDTVRAPDVAFIAQDRIPAGGVPVKFIPFAPDLAVEVVSPGDTLVEVEEKVQDWLDAGTKLVWVVNSKRRTVTIHRASADLRVLRENDSLNGEDVVPGFSMRVGELFA